jgi:NAD(P)-dependent dehydrogenase (short-subunit alcohol dehydrogenase family)
MKPCNTQIAVVSGGSAGIGAAICTELLDAGCRVFNLDVQPGTARHDRLAHRAVDLTDLEAVRNIAAVIAQEHRVTTLVHNAGALREKPLAQVGSEDVDYLMRLHVGSLVVLAQAFTPAMRAVQFGRIVVIASRAVLGLEHRTAYSATKAAQAGLMRTWAMEFAASGITVNAIAPGPIVTDQFRSVIPQDDPRNAAIAARVPVGRLGEPGDISRVVTFLVDGKSDFITGQCLFVCGGASLGAISYR